MINIFSPRGDRMINWANDAWEDSKKHLNPVLQLLQDNMVSPLAFCSSTCANICMSKQHVLDRMRLSTLESLRLANKAGSSCKRTTWFIWVEEEEGIFYACVNATIKALGKKGMLWSSVMTPCTKWITQNAVDVCSKEMNLIYCKT